MPQVWLEGRVGAREVLLEVFCHELSAAGVTAMNSDSRGVVLLKLPQIRRPQNRGCLTGVMSVTWVDRTS